MARVLRANGVVSSGHSQSDRRVRGEYPAAGYAHPLRVGHARLGCARRHGSGTLDEAYLDALRDRLAAAAMAALSDRFRATLTTGSDQCGFAASRRKPMEKGASSGSRAWPRLTITRSPFWSRRTSQTGYVSCCSAMPATRGAPALSSKSEETTRDTQSARSGGATRVASRFS